MGCTQGTVARDGHYDMVAPKSQKQTGDQSAGLSSRTTSLRTSSTQTKSSSQIQKSPSTTSARSSTRSSRPGYPSTTSCYDGDAADFLQAYILGERLGKGSFGEVRAVEATTSSSKGSYAVKIVKMHDGDDAFGQDSDQLANGSKIKNHTVRKGASQVVQEVKIWRKAMEAQEPLCVKLHAVFRDEDRVFLVMERCDQTLWAHLNAIPHLDEAALCNIFKQMAAAIAGLHNVQVVHRDVKPDNFVVNRLGQVQVCDFGLSAVNTSTLVPGIVGTPVFMSPEMLALGRSDEQTDIWSLGVLMYVLLYGEFPYDSPQSLLRAYKEGHMKPRFRVAVGLPNAPSRGPSSRLQNLLQIMLNFEKTRPNAVSVIELLSCYGERPEWSLHDRDHSLDAPSFKPMLQGAMKAGAFSSVIG